MDEAEVAAYVPMAQDEHEVEPAAEEEPTEQDAQLDASEVVEKVPCIHVKTVNFFLFN